MALGSLGATGGAHLAAAHGFLLRGHKDACKNSSQLPPNSAQASLQPSLLFQNIAGHACCSPSWTN